MASHELSGEERQKIATLFKKIVPKDKTEVGEQMVEDILDPNTLETHDQLIAYLYVALDEIGIPELALEDRVLQEFGLLE